MIWQPRDGLRVRLSRQHKHNVTVIGALSTGKVFTRLANTTNATTVEQFFVELGEAHNLFGAVVVADNHRAHISVKVRSQLEEQGCLLLLLPPASSILNPIETLWARVKAQWRQQLLVTDTAVMGENWMRRELAAILSSFNEEQLENLARAHLRDAYLVLKEAAEQPVQQINWSPFSFR